MRLIWHCESVAIDNVLLSKSVPTDVHCRSPFFNSLRIFLSALFLFLKILNGLNPTWEDIECQRFYQTNQVKHKIYEAIFSTFILLLQPLRCYYSLKAVAQTKLVTMKK